MSESGSAIPLFEEEQLPPWPFTALGVSAPAIGGLLAARSLTWAARFGIAGVAAAGVGLGLREFAFPMQTSVFPNEIQVLFGRRTRFRIPLRNVVRAYAVTYDPLRDYGGWGIRNGRDGRAFNMSGNQGVQMVMRSGLRIMVGSARAETLASIIQDLTGCDPATEEGARPAGSDRDERTPEPPPFEEELGIGDDEELGIDEEEEPI